jgi:predicted AAA+ superfamily ATPase
MTEFFDLNEVQRILQGFNPWWSGKTSVVPAFRRLAFGVCLRHLEDESLRRAVLLSGPRRVGKTTILLQIADWLLQAGRASAGIFYISLDHPLLKLLSLTEILRLYHENVYAENKPCILLMDEVQYAMDWELHVKALVDHGPHYRILATGSASVVHRRQLSESGVGRWVRVQVPTLSFYEFLRIRDEPLPNIPNQITPKELFLMDQREQFDLGARLRPIQPLFLRYLLVGGFPETARHPDFSFCQRILREDVVERVLKRDMTALFNVRNVNALERLFIYLCLHSGGLLDVQNCAKALQVQRPTVDNYLEILEQANLIYRLPPAEIGGKKILKVRNKVYLVDAALRNAVLLRGEEILNNSEEMGVVVETTVLRHLIAFSYQDSPKIFYWRAPKGGQEVDVIVKSPAYTLPVEIKYRESPSLGEKSGLVLYCELEKVDRAFWVTKSEDDFGLVQIGNLATRFMKIPAHIFTYLLGQTERVPWEPWRLDDRRAQQD